MDKHSLSTVESPPVSSRVKLMIPNLMIVMGVSVSGKSTIAEHLASSLKSIYLDTDDYHPPNNIEKMSRGEAPIVDDRCPWLKTFGQMMATNSKHCVCACSSLKRSFRTYLIEPPQKSILFIYLNGSKELLMQLISSSKDHFTLTTQLNTLEVTEAGEHTISVDISGKPDEIIMQIKQQVKELYND